MSKELEKEYLADLDHFDEGVGIHSTSYQKCKERLIRLAEIESANPSEALKCVDKLEQVIEEITISNADLRNTLKASVSLAVIKQALLKQQEQEIKKLSGSQYHNIIIDEAEQPKQYLKWEDLEFNHTPKMVDVKMNGSKYKLVCGYNVVGNNLVILRNDKQQYCFLEADKQFFNDLHLEVLGE